MNVASRMPASSQTDGTASNQAFGVCPNCDTPLPVAASRCHVCKALFSADSAWHVIPDGRVGPALTTAAEQEEASQARTAGPATGQSRRSLNAELSCLYRGELGLARTFWLHGVLAPTVIAFVFAIAFVATGFEPLLGLGFLLNIAYTLAGLVGLWRAAARVGDASTAAVLARVYVVASLMFWPFAFLGAVGQ